MRETPVVLEDLYSQICKIPSDINEHLPLLRELASKCEHVTEFGMRGGMSTIALLAGQPETLISWDINSAAIVSETTAFLCNNRGRTSFQPRVGDTLKIVTEPTDLLFIDTLHTGRQLLDELKRHADKAHPCGANYAPHGQSVRKYLAFHDTATFGMVGEDGKEPGLRAAIRFYQRNWMFPLWELIEDRPNNNGLVVLKHVCADGHGPLLRGHCSQCGEKLDA